MVRRMTQISKKNLQIADAVFIEKVEGQGYRVRVCRGSSSAYISDADSPIIYRDVALANRMVKRFRSDLKASTI